MEKECSNTSCSRESCEGCPSAAGHAPTDFRAPANPHSKIKHVIGIVSGKGGVGKSSVTAMTAIALNREGYRVGILDADITGPSIPKMFGVTQAEGVTREEFMLPAQTQTGIKIMSVNLLLESEETPVIWRGPVIAGVVKQFWSDVVWGELDYLLVDMPPGTGDVPLTVFQSLPVDGVLLVTTPQRLVEMVVTKAWHMCREMNIPVLGLVENLSYVSCPECGKKIPVFGEKNFEAWSAKTGVPLCAELPIDPELADFADTGRMEQYICAGLEDVIARMPM